MKVSASLVFFSALVLCAMAAPKPEPQLFTIVIPAAGFTLGTSGLTIGGALAAKGLIKLGFAKGVALASAIPEEEGEVYGHEEESSGYSSLGKRMLTNYVAMPKQVGKMISKNMPHRARNFRVRHQ